jgi:hypothetical protein
MSKRFDRLREHVAREYEAKGIPKAEAEAWGAGTAAKIARGKGDAPGGKPKEGDGK